MSDQMQTWRNNIDYTPLTSNVDYENIKNTVDLIETYTDIIIDQYGNKYNPNQQEQLKLAERFSKALKPLSTALDVIRVGDAIAAGEGQKARAIAFGYAVGAISGAVAGYFSGGAAAAAAAAIAQDLAENAYPDIEDFSIEAAGEVSESVDRTLGFIGETYFDSNYRVNVPENHKWYQVNYDVRFEKAIVTVVEHTDGEVNYESHSFEYKEEQKRYIPQGEIDFSRLDGVPIDEFVKKIRDPDTGEVVGFGGPQFAKGLMDSVPDFGHGFILLQSRNNNGVYYLIAQNADNSLNGQSVLKFYYDGSTSKPQAIEAVFGSIEEARQEIGSVADIVKIMMSKYCFGENTAISMWDGSSKRICDIRAGDKVKAFDENDVLGEIKCGVVSATSKRENVNALILDNGMIVTNGHPFATIDGRFREVSEILGEAVGVNEGGETARIGSLAKNLSDTSVYNFTVDVFHTYIADGYRVHNVSIGTFNPVTEEGIDGSFLGAKVARFFAPDNVALSLLTEAAGGVVGGYLGELATAVTGGTAVNGQRFTVDDLFDDTINHLPTRFASSLLGVGVSFGTTQLGGLIGKGFNSLLDLAGADHPLLQQISGVFGAHIAQYTVSMAGFQAIELFGLTGNDWAGQLIGDVTSVGFENGVAKLPSFDVAGLATTVANVVASYAAKQVVGLLFDGETKAQVLGGEIGGQVFGFIGDRLLPGFGGPIGTFLGTIVGSVIGRLFGGPPPVPQAYSVLDDNSGTNEFEVVFWHVEDGGSEQVARSFAAQAQVALTGFSEAIGGFLGDPERFAYGHREDKFFYDSWDSGIYEENGDANYILQKGVVTQLKTGDFFGADIYAKKALDDFGGWKLQELQERISVAQKYGQYLDNRVLFNEFIGSLEGAVSDSALDIAAQTVADNWAYTKATAVALGLHNAKPEFYTNVTAGKLKINRSDSTTLVTTGGSDRNDLMVGGTGKDLLRGGRGDDVYRFERGYGKDTIEDTYAYTEQLADQPVWVTLSHEGCVNPNTNPGNILPPGAAAGAEGESGCNTLFSLLSGGYDDNVIYFDAGTDTLELGENIGLEDLVFDGSGSNLTIGIRDESDPSAGMGSTDDRIVLRDWDYDHRRVEVLRLSDGSEYSLTDSIGSGAELSELDRVKTVSTHGQDLVGFAGADTLTNGSGHNLLRGGKGDDLYVFRRGDIQDTIHDVNTIVDTWHSVSLRSNSTLGESRNYYTNNQHNRTFDLDGGSDTLSFEAGITAEHIRLERPAQAQPTDPLNDNLFVYVLDQADLDAEAQGNLDLGNVGDRIVIQDWFQFNRRVEFFQFADGQTYVVGSDGAGGYGLSRRSSTAEGQRVPSVLQDDEALSLPIVAFDLGNDGLHTVDQRLSSALFDLDGDGYREPTAWVGFSDGILVMDRNNNGKVDGLNELFTTDAAAASSSDLALLSSLDADNDGQVVWYDDSDANYNKLRIWTDNNLDGQVQVGEWHQLHRFGISSFESGVGASGYRGDEQSDGSRFVGYYRQVDANYPVLGRMFDVRLLFKKDGTRFTENGDGSTSVDYEASSQASALLAGDAAGVSRGAVGGVVTGSSAGETIFADPPRGGDVGAMINGESGSDTLIGNRADDVLIGGSGRDRMYGGDGDDLVVADSDDFTIIEGAQNDTVVLQTVSASRIQGGSGEDILSLEVPEDVTIDPTELGFEGILTGSGDDKIIIDSSVGALVASASGDDDIRGGSGDDLLYGGSGEDFLSGRSGLDMLAGGDGDDLMLVNAVAGGLFAGGSGTDAIDFRNRNAAVTVNLTDGLVTAGGLIDTLVSVEQINGTDFAGDTLFGGSGANFLKGRQGGDRLHGGSGSDWAIYDEVTSSEVIRANLLNGVGSSSEALGDSYTSIENLRGGRGDDTLVGDTKANTLVGGIGGDRLVGGGGNDAAGYMWASSGVKASLKHNEGTGGEAAGDSFIDIVKLIGSDYNDTLEGGGGNTLIGGSGNDRLISTNKFSDSVFGGSGRDTWDFANATNGVTINLWTAGQEVKSLEDIVGGAHADILNGGVHNQLLNGGGGADTINARTAGLTLAGGAGAGDLITGTSGRDTFWIGRNDGRDTLAVSDKNVSVESTVWYTATNTIIWGGADQNITVNTVYRPTGSTISVPEGNGRDVIRFAEGILPGNISIHRAAENVNWTDDATIVVGGSGNNSAIVVDGGFYDVAMPGTFAFSDGLELPAAAFLGSTLEMGNNSDNELGLTASVGETVFRVGRSGADTLWALAPFGTLYGGSGNDSYKGTNGRMQIVEAADGGIDRAIVYGSGWHSLHDNVENLRLYDGYDNLNGQGNDLANHMSGNNLANHLHGGGADDTIFGASGVDRLAGNGSRDSLFGGPNGDTIWGGAGDDTANGGASIDTIFGDLGQDTLRGAEGDDKLYGGSGADTLFGNSAVDTLWGGNRDDVLDGGDGADTMFGGNGDDTMRLSESGDVVVENSGEGSDMVIAPFSLTLREDFSNVENAMLETGSSGLKLEGTSGRNTLLGNTQDNSFDGGTGNDYLDGGLGSDTMKGGLGNDTFVLDTMGDTVNEASAGDGVDKVFVAFDATLLSGFKENFGKLEDLELTGLAAVGRGNAADNKLTGNVGTDTLLGKTGDDILDGGSGSDTMDGGEGNDTFHIDHKGDVIIDSGGVDLAILHVDSIARDLDPSAPIGHYTMAEGLNHLRMQPGIAYDVSGNTLGNKISGNDQWNSLFGGRGYDSLVGLGGDDYLDGGSGQDFLKGGLGNDTYEVDNLYDSVVEVTGEGDKDKVRSWIDYTIGSAVEDLELLGSAIIEGRGNGGDNEVTGNSAANTLRGFGGDDTLLGGSGGDNLIGHTGDDTLDGGSGVDTMRGNSGSDTFFVDRSGDVVMDYESAAGGSMVNNGTADHVIASDNYTLSTRVEILSLEGVAEIGAGNLINNVIYGNDAANRLYGLNNRDTLFGGLDNDTLDGGVNADILYGGKASDTFIIDRLAVFSGTQEVSAGDTAIEYAGGGTDDLIKLLITPPLSASEQVTFTIADHVENLEIGESGTIHALGNSGQNEITGNSARNSINGLDANDTLWGASGGDWLRGNSGQDTLFGGHGNDDLLGHHGDDELKGDSGSDSLRGGTGDDTLAGHEGGDHVLGQTGNDQLNGGDDDDTVEGGSGNDQAWGGAGIDLVLGGDGDDTLHGGNGEDSLNGESGVDLVYGGNSNDALRGNSGADTLYGGEGDDTQFGHIGNDKLNGGSGDDTLRGLTGNDTLAADEGNDVAEGGWGDDKLGGNDGDDKLYGGSGSDRASGADGLDTIWGGTGVDTLMGGGENDELRGGNGIDSLFGGGGHDSLWGNAGDDSLVGNAGDDIIRGSGGDDIVTGDTGNDVLLGNTGADTLVGGTGSDTLFGGDGDDILNGVGGHDTLKGGEGSDTYYHGRGRGQDVIDQSDALAADTDVVQFLQSSPVNPDDLWFYKDGDHLKIGILGTNDHLTLNDWYTTTDRVDEFQVLATGGTGTATLVKSDVAALVQEMANYATSADHADAQGYTSNLPNAVSNKIDQLWSYGS